MRRTRRVGAAFLAVFLIQAGACSSASGPEDPVLNPIELPRSLTASEAAVIAQSNAFGLDLFRETVERDERPNIVLSPLSASMALGMTMNGAAGETFAAMRTTLGFDGLSLEEINDSYRSLIELLEDLDPEVEFTIANSVWANDDVTFLDSFFQSVMDAFDARVEARDFSAAPTLEEINGWVSDKTNGKIEKIVDQLDPQLVMLLLNAIYFDASWTTRFDPERTRATDFRRADGSTVSVEMMSLGDETLSMGGGADFSAVELPYGGGAYSMVIVVPQPSTDARTLMAGMDDARWQAILASLAPRDVDLVSIPKLTLTYDVLLNDALKDMGMDVAFRDEADFTRMSPDGDRFCISFVRQKTFLEVDEEGTTAAAVTGVGVGTTSFNGIVADRPYIFAIRERLSNTTLFIGLVGDPTAADSGPADATMDCV